MRIIKILLAIIGVLVIIVISTGLLVPTFEYGNSVAVNAPAESCWKVFHDTSRMNRWNEGFQSLVLTKGDTLEEGAEYKLTLNQGEVMVMKQKVIRLNAPESISYELNNDVLKSEYTYAFEGDGAKTNISTRYAVTGNNVFMKAILFYSKSYLQRADRQALEKLKMEIESEN
jgi:hypothetical protein